MNFFRTIHETIHDEIIPRIRFGFLYPFAKAGVISAQLSIADILFYQYRSWEPKNPEQWVEKGVEKGIPAAFILKGHFCRYKGRDDWDESSLLEAFGWYKKAADMNDASGQFYTFAMYDNYRYVLNVKPTGAKYLKLAAENGCPTAQYVFAQKCLEKDDFKNGLYWMKKAAKCPKREWLKPEGYMAENKNARKWYRNYKNILTTKELAAAGDPKALYEYSQYLLRDSHKRDALILSHEWHTKAAVAGYPKAMSEEGDFIIHGWVSGRLEDAFDYYSRAYDAGYKPASRGLGDCYFYGWGTERNREKAIFFYKIARRSGVGINLKELQKMTEEEFQQVDGDEALECVRQCYN